MMWFGVTQGEVPFESLQYSWEYWMWGINIAAAVMLVQFFANLYLWRVYADKSIEFRYTKNILGNKQ